MNKQYSVLITEYIEEHKDLNVRNKAFIIVLDAGHSEGKAHNRGSVCSNEGDNNYNYSLVLKRELEKIKGVFVILTRNKPSDNPSLTKRGAIASGADLFLSLHSNGGPAQVKGTEVFDSVRRKNNKLATRLAKDISNLFGHQNRGAKYKAGQSGWDWYGVLRSSGAKSSMIIEHGFHSNTLDCNFFKNNHSRIAQVTAKAIAEHYGLKYNGSQSTVNGGESSMVYYGIGSPHNTKSAVQKLQQDLVKAGFSVGSYGSNGVMGKDTSNAIKSFQRKHGLKVDGFAGKDTLLRLKQVLTPVANKKYYKVQAGAFSTLKEAEAMVSRLKKAGFDSFIKYE